MTKKELFGLVFGGDPEKVYDYEFLGGACNPSNYQYWCDIVAKAYKMPLGIERARYMLIAADRGSAAAYTDFINMAQNGYVLGKICRDEISEIKKIMEPRPGYNYERLLIPYTRIYLDPCRRSGGIILPSSPALVEWEWENGKYDILQDNGRIIQRKKSEVFLSEIAPTKTYKNMSNTY